MKTLILILTLIVTEIQAETLNVDFNDFNATVGIVIKKPKLRTVCSGILLNPKVVLTAAHCLHELTGADIVAKKEISPREFAGLTLIKHKAVAWRVHPQFDPEVASSVDVGLIFLDKPFSSSLNYPFLIEPEFKIMTNLALERIGYGKREGVNKRTWITTGVLSALFGYIKTDDQYGMGGDSGGPLFLRMDRLYLLGLHTGRDRDADKKQLNASFAISLTNTDIQNWIQKEISNYKFKR